MAHVANHLSLAELEERYRSSEAVTTARHYQTIWLLAQGRTIPEVSATVSFAPRWIEELLARYNALGAAALGDRRCHNGAKPSVLKPELLRRLEVRLKDPPPDGGVWTCAKVANWMAKQLGLAKLAPQRGWEALTAIGWSIPSPRPKNPTAATPEEEAAFKKLADTVAEEAHKHPDKPVEVWATDERRLGLKPIQRRVWAPIGERPIALGHHRYDWLYFTAFVAPASGETVWYLSNGLDQPFFLPSGSRPCRARPAPAAIASSFCSSSKPDGMGQRTCPFQTASASSIRPPARPNCSPPSTCGRSSTSRSPTNTSLRSTISTLPSPSAAAICIKTAHSSQATANFIGGRNP